MKRYAGLAIFVAVLSAPAHAQSNQSRSAGTSAGAPTNIYSGGGGGGGGLSGSNSSRLPSYARAQFGVAAVSGTDGSFVPSSFLSFEQAVAVGKAAQAGQKSLGEIATENSSAQKEKSKVAFVQDADGNLVSVPR